MKKASRGISAGRWYRDIMPSRKVLRSPRRNITVEEMRAIISARNEKGWNDPNPKKRAQWRKIPCEGEIPTPDEWMRYAVEKLQEKGREGLLWRYI